jgi:pilus assembly protein Flp/PilA
MSKILARFAKDESGATAIEYGLIAALIALAIITGASMLGNSLNAAFSGIAGKLDTEVAKGVGAAADAGGE